MAPVNNNYNNNKNLSNSWVQLTQPIHTSINSFQIGMMHHQALEYVNPFTLTVGYQFFTQVLPQDFSSWRLGKLGITSMKNMRFILL